MSYHRHHRRLGDEVADALAPDVTAQIPDVPMTEDTTMSPDTQTANVTLVPDANQDYKSINGVFYGTTDEKSNLFYSLQDQLNRVAFIKNVAAIGRDGQIGTETTGFSNKVLGRNDSVAMVAAAADYLRGLAANLADKLGAPATVPAPAAPAPKHYDQALNAVVNNKAPPPANTSGSMLDAFKNLSTTSILMLGVAAIAGIYYVTKKPTKGTR